MPQAGQKDKSLFGLAALAAAIAAFPVLVPNPYYLNVANIIGLNTIIVVGLNLLIGYAGQISLGHAAFYGLGAYISGILTVTYNVPPWPALVIAACLTGVTALLIGIPTLRLQGHYLVMATLGFNLIVNIVIIQWDSVTGGPSGFPGIPSLSIGPWALDSDKKMYYLIWAAVFISIILALNLVRSRVGRGLRALHSSEIAASCQGVRTEWYKVKIFVLSAIYASVAGSLYASYLSFVSPKTFDIFCSVELVTMVIVGGMGNIWGVLFGTAFLTSLPNLLHAFDEYKDVFYGLILVVILIFLPQGVGGAIRDQWQARRAGKRPATTVDESKEESGQPLPPKPAIACGGAADLPATSTSTNTILRVDGITMRFGGLLALAQVSFDLPEGAVTALIGPNGSGKTTMINIISGIYRPQEGRISFENRAITGFRSYKIAKMGLTRTFQNVQIFEHMTVLENVTVGMHAGTRGEFCASMLHLPNITREEKEIEQQAWEALAFFNLEDRAHWPASGLSFGQQKRLEMARALVSHPKLVLLDEPVAGLNMSESREMARLIAKLRARGISVLIVEHDMNLVMGISDLVVVLNYGRKIAEGSPREVQRNEEVLSAYLGRVA